MFPLFCLKTMFGKNCWLFRSVELVIVSQDTEGWLVTLSCFWLGFLQLGVTRSSSRFPVLTFVVTLLLQTCRQYSVLDFSHSPTYKKLSWKSWCVGEVDLEILVLIQRKIKVEMGWREPEWYKRSGKATEGSCEEWGLSLGGRGEHQLGFQ